MRNFFLNRTLKKEAEEAELDRTAERRKGFWGKRRVRRPTLKGKHVHEVPIAAPGGGTVQGAKDEARQQRDKTPPPTPAGKGEAVIPNVEDRAEGDFYEDEADARPLDGPQQPGKLMHSPHLDRKSVV